MSTGISRVATWIAPTVVAKQGTAFFRQGRGQTRCPSESTNMAHAHQIELSSRSRRAVLSRCVGPALCLIIALYFIGSAGFALMNFERYGAAPPQFTRYILIPALLGAAFILFPLVLSRRKAVIIGIYSASILAALFMAETVLTAQMLPTLSSNLGRLDEAQRRLVENDHELIRGFTLRRLNNLSDVDSLEETKLSGFADARTILCTPPEGMVAYKADRYGFNNPDRVYDQPIDIALVGDSFVEGFCLPEGKDLAAALRAQSGENVVSLGIRGNGPLIELATIGRFGPALQPKHVIMAFFEGNDWKNLEFELTEPWLREALAEQADFGSVLPAPETTERRSWDLIQTLTEKPVSNLELMRRTSLARNFFALHRVGLSLGIVYPKAPSAIPEFENVLMRTKSTVEAWGGSFSLLYIPQLGRFNGFLPTDFVFDQLRTLVMDAAVAADVDVIDLVPVFHAEANANRFYGTDGHFTEEGAAFTADFLSRTFESRTNSPKLSAQESNNSKRGML